MRTAIAVEQEALRGPAPERRDGAPTSEVAGAHLLGTSPAMTRLRAEIVAIARNGFGAVLVQGESGVGKELVAESLRRASARAGGPYEVFDCPAVPEDHLESELFGTVRGAFPGAIDKRGTLERAHGGTVFFDEIAAMRRDHQAKVLRTIEGKSFRRVGGSSAVSVDVAVVAAAHEDLVALVARGQFRHDLYYRLIRDGVLLIPPLRERREDVAVLVRDYVVRLSVRVEPAALEHLSAYDWPGNVRQLQTALRVALRLERGILSADAVDEALRRFAPVSTLSVEASALPPGGGADDLRRGHFHAITARAQRRALLRAYDAAAGNKTAAGVLLGFHLSPGEVVDPTSPLSEARRNLALRKFRYWCGRLDLAGALQRRPVAGGGRPVPMSEPIAIRDRLDP